MSEAHSPKSECGYVLHDLQVEISQRNDGEKEEGEATSNDQYYKHADGESSA